VRHRRHPRQLPHVVKSLTPVVLASELAARLLPVNGLTDSASAEATESRLQPRIHPRHPCHSLHVAVSISFVICSALLVVWAARPPAAQRLRVDWGAQAIPTLTETNVVPGNRTLGELRVVQPVGMLELAGFGDRIHLLAAVDFEKYTITHGELAPGDWGEGFEDRRHPHTLVRQLMLVFRSPHATAGAGKGF